MSKFNSFRTHGLGISSIDLPIRCSKAIVLADSLYDKESINVAATRAKEDLVVYTEDKKSLYPQIDHDGRNFTSHEVIETFDYNRSNINLKNKAKIERDIGI